MPKKKKHKPIILSSKKHNNPYALNASMRDASKFKEKAAGRGGAKNNQRDLLKDTDD